MKAILYIDYKAGTSESIEYIDLTAKTEATAILEAEEILDKKEDVYLAKIFIKEGRTEKEDGTKIETFSPKFCKRSIWRDTKNEFEFKIKRYQSKVWIDYEVII